MSLFLLRGDCSSETDWEKHRKTKIKGQHAQLDICSRFDLRGTRRGKRNRGLAGEREGERIRKTLLGRGGSPASTISRISIRNFKIQLLSGEREGSKCPLLTEGLKGKKVWKQTRQKEKTGSLDVRR